MHQYLTPAAILVGFFLLSVAVLLKKNEFETCVSYLDSYLPDDFAVGKRQLGLATKCMPQ